MAFFGKGNNSSAPEPPPNLSDVDLSDASRLMNRWDASMGNSDATWDCLEALARRGGFKGDQASLREVANGKDAGDVIQRPWRWWNEAARLASSRGDDVLAGRIFLFAFLFMNQMAAKMSAGDMMQTGLDRPKSSTYQALAATAVTSLVRLPETFLIHDTATGKVDVAGALRMAKDVSGMSGSS